MRVLGVIGALAAGAADVAAEERTSPLPGCETLSLELTPLWFNTGRADRPQTPEEDPHAHPVSVGAALSARLFTSRFTWWYWTRVAVGAGYVSGPGYVFHVTTEPGVYITADNRFLELGVGVGIGQLALATSSSQCDAKCLVGGAPILVSPTLRLGVDRATGLRVAAVVRGIVPASSDPGPGIDGWIGGFGASVLVGVELGR